MNANLARYQALAERGCICGGDHDGPFTCPLHPGPSDNRGIAAWFKAQMPLGFPMTARCARVLTRDADGRALTICGTEGLMYPDPGEDDGAPAVHRPSLVCPRCSVPASESYLRFAAERKGFTLNGKRVFGVAA